MNSNKKALFGREPDFAHSKTEEVCVCFINLNEYAFALPNSLQL